MTWDQGGYFPPSYLGSGAVAFFVLGGLLVVRAPSFPLTRRSLLALTGLLGLAAWTGLSTLWSAAPATGLAAMQRDVCYAGLFGLALVAAGSGRYARVLVWSVLAAIVAIAGAGLLSRLYPDLIRAPLVGMEQSRLAQSRLEYPLGYWNSYGALAGMGAVLALGLAADVRTNRTARAGFASLSVLMSVAVYFSLSRGAWLAVLVGLLALGVVGVRRGSLLMTGAVVALATGAAIFRLRSYNVLVQGPLGGPGFAERGHAFAGELALVAVAAGAANAVLAGARDFTTSLDVVRAARRQLRRFTAGAVALVAVIALIAGGGRAQRFVSTQWHDFMQPTSFVSSSSSRLSSAKGSRSELWRVALDGFLASPVQGDGAGGYEVRWNRMRKLTESVRNAHSLELETLSDLGLVGAAFLVLFIGSIGAGAVRGRVAPTVLGRMQAAAVSSTLVVWLVHSAVDWDWQMTAVTAVALALGAVLCPAGYGTRRRREQQPALAKGASATV